MNNEPVAWTACLDCGKRVTGDSIHTCSPQIKELTDEEITQCLNESMDIKGVWGQPMMELNPVNFARAILRKAQEK